MRFAHISDSHIGAQPGFVSNGHQALANLDALVETINALTFPVDFVLHSGDVSEDGSESSYRLAKAVLDRLRIPIRYVAGNHDDGDVLQRILLGGRRAGERLDYQEIIGGVTVVVRDTRGPNVPGGTLTDTQLGGLAELCHRNGPPMILCLHHPPVSLDSAWLDPGWTDARGTHPSMLLDRGRELLDVLAPARDRIRGVFFGHVHRSYQVVQNGILFSGAQSAVAQLLTWPDQARPAASEEEPAGFCLVTVTGECTTVRQHAVPRPVVAGTTR
jgi:Icc protein